MMQVDPGHKQYNFRAEHWGPEYYEYRKKWSENPKEGVVGEYPLNLDIETTNHCNLRCPFCVREHMNEGEGDFAWGNFIKVCKEITPGKVPAMKFNWRGESTLYEDLPNAIEYAKKAGVIETMINTNGTMLDETMCHMLCESGLDRIIISIDSIEKSVYEMDLAVGRLGADLDQVLGNIHTLLRVRDLYPENRGRPYVRVQKIDFPQTRQENFLGFFQELGVDTVGINTYKQKDPSKVPDWDPLPCAQPFQRLVITWKGDFLPCCQGNNFPPIGNIERMTIKEAWNSELMKELRVMHATGRQALVPACKVCETTRPE